MRRGDGIVAEGVVSADDEWPYACLWEGGVRPFGLDTAQGKETPSLHPAPMNIPRQLLRLQFSDQYRQNCGSGEVLNVGDQIRETCKWCSVLVRFSFEG